MAEGPDLASEAVGSEAPVEPTRTPEEAHPKPVVEAEPKIPTAAQPVAEVSTLKKPEPVKSKLVLRDEPKEPPRKQKRVSQRSLERGMTKETGAATASEAVEISSDEDRENPTKPGEIPDSTTSHKESHPIEEPETHVHTDQEEENPTKPGEDLTTTPSRPVEKVPVETQNRQPTAQERPSAPKSLKEELEEERYELERKRKGKAQVKTKESSKKSRTANTGVVIREQSKGVVQPRRKRVMRNTTQVRSSIPRMRSLWKMRTIMKDSWRVSTANSSTLLWKE